MMPIQSRNRSRLFPLIGAILGSSVVFLTAATTPAAAPAEPQETAKPSDTRPKLYVIGYSHLDTQWRWSYPQVISEFLKNTLHDNFKLFDKYPHYVFNFTGANRYMMFKEYYPQDYLKLKQYIADGRWFPAGSSMEEGDVNMPDGEAIIRQVLYGNEFFRKEFGKQSNEFMLPDCFGFQATLPSVLAHCGIKGFSTQKLTWGSAVGIPFNVGVWEGPDGRSVVAALNPGSYSAPITEDLGRSGQWEKRLAADAKRSGVAVDYHYYGVGDKGGSPTENSVKLLEKSISADAPINVISGPADQMFNELTPAQIAKLPRYNGDLLLTGHSTGELTSEAFMKRSERKIEQLADAAERTSVIANWLGSAAYPMEKLNAAWTLALGSHFHDTMAGTALPKAYEYAWNNEVLALNQFAAVAEDGAGGVIRALDTRTKGVPIVVYNPLSTEREDVAEATVSFPDAATDSVTVYGPDGNVVPSQVVSHGGQVKILFLAKAPSVGYAVYDVRPGGPAEASSTLKVTENTLENNRYKVTINADGDIASVMDKINHREVLSAPARLAMLYERPEQWPAWNMDYKDRSAAPIAYVSGPAKMRIVEKGPARVAIEVERVTKGSKFKQTIRLSAGGDRVEVVANIDWNTPQTSLEAVFPLTAGNPMATYESQSAAIERGNNNPKKFEVPQQQWFDVTDTSGASGTAILNDSKYGSDKPDDHTVRLTLLYTPGVRGDYQDQGSQDIGRHEMVYAIAPHNASWQGTVPWNAQRLNQPLLTFQSPMHEGPLGKSFSFCRVTNPQVTTTAIKKAEDSEETIIRLHETTGRAADGVRVIFASKILSAREVDGQEREIGPASVQDGRLVVNMTPFALKAFAVKLAPAAETARLTAPVSQPLPLAFDMDGFSTHENLSDGSFDTEGHTYAAEGLPARIVSEGIPFTVGPTADGQKNVLACRGQSIPIPAGDFNRVYVLASAVGGDIPATFIVDGKPEKKVVQDWSGYIGQWDNRLWQGVVPGLTYSWKNRLAGLTPGFIKRDTVAYFYSHRHHPDNGNEYYQFAYIFKYRLDLPAGAKTLTLPDNDKVRVFAITAARDTNDDVVAARPLYDTLSDRGTTTAEADGPTIEPDGGKFNTITTVTIKPPLYWKQGSLHYTIDGSEPTDASPVYSKPFILNGPATVRARELTAGSTETKATFDINDTTPPAVVSVAGLAAVPSVSIELSAPVRKDQAEMPGNYHFTPALEVSSAKLSDDGTQVTLTLAKPPGAGEFHLVLSGITDNSPNANPVVPAPTALTLSEPVFTLDSYVCSGEGMEKKVDKLPTKAGDAWTINFFVKPARQVEDRTIIAGFGRNSDSAAPGSGRYLTKFAEGIHFWSRNADAEGTAPFDTRRWQMITATYDGHTVKLYKNGHPVGEQQVSLSNDEPVIRIAPLDPWEGSRRFTGEIRDMTVWSTALPAETLAVIGASAPQN